MHALRAKVNLAIEEILEQEDDEDLVEEFRLEFLYPLDPNFAKEADDFNKNDISTLLSNVRAFYESIPENSPIRTSIIYTLFDDLPAKFISEFLRINLSSIYKALNPERVVHPLRFYLTQLEFLRNRLGERERTLFDWFIVRCIVPSGKNKRYYRHGTPESMWLEYAKYCTSLSEEFIDEKTFHEIRKKERVGILKGDIFISPLKHELAEAQNTLEQLRNKKKPHSQKVKSDISLAEKLIAEIESRLEWNEERKKAYQNAHRNLENDADTAVITLDFYGTGKTTVSLGDDDGDFVDLIVVIATKDELVLPKSFLDSQIEPVVPVSTFTPDIAKKLLLPKDRTPKSSYSKEPKAITSHMKLIKVQRTEKKLPPVEVTDAARYVPHLTYFHCLSKKKLGKISVKQTHDYLMYFLNFLFLKHKILLGISNWEIWSDGCSKHFKTYPSHYYISTLQLQLAVNISWDFLPPNDAHNRADAQAGSFSQIIQRAINNTFVLNEIGHLMEISKAMKNCYKFEAVYGDFPERLSVTTKDCFIQDTFTITYGAPTKEWTGCNHRCEDKGI